MKLCESIPGRNLSCCDWFRKGQRLFDIDNDGILLMKEYGRNSRWEPVEIYDKLCNCAYLNPYIALSSFQGTRKSFNWQRAREKR